MEVTEHALGTFCWTELETSDAAGAKQFYRSLFGWEYQDNPMGEEMVYTMVQLRGKNLGALYQDSKPGVPPHWTSYVRVPSADESASQAKTLGGTVIAEPFDVMEHGRMAVLQDPTGAVFCVWQQRQHHGAQIVGEPGAFCWHELMTKDLQAAKTFYTGLFMWSTKKNDSVDYYTEFQAGGKSFAGMMAITPEMGDVPPNWLPYLMVDDCDATVAKAQQLGGAAHVPGKDIPGVGRIAVLADPQGAAFAIIAVAM